MNGMICAGNNRIGEDWIGNRAFASPIALQIAVPFATGAELIVVKPKPRSFP